MTLREYQNNLTDYTDNMLTYEYSELKQNISFSDGQQKELFKSKASRVLREMSKRKALQC